MAADNFSFRLYVAAGSPNSVRALGNLRDLCERYLPDRHQVEVVDVMRDPNRALADGIFMTPVLVKMEPGPACRVVGNLSDLPGVLQALGLTDV